MSGTVAVNLPMLDAGEGLVLIIGGFIEIDRADESAVVITYVGGGKRTLTEGQSEKFLKAVGLKQSRIESSLGLARR